jgi:arylsulfatase A-like enzyme
MPHTLICPPRALYCPAAGGGTASLRASGRLQDIRILGKQSVTTLIYGCLRGAATSVGSLLLPLWACSAPPPLPDVLLISLDTLRADAPMASLDRLQESSVFFDRAYSPMPFTLPAHISLFTGLAPDAHFVTTQSRSLPEDGIPTLAEILGASGYSTVGLHTNDWLHGKFGFAQGFEEYEMLPHGTTYADRVSAAALERVDWSNPTRPPVFLFLHYMDAHSDFVTQGGGTQPYFSPPEDLEDLTGDLADTSFCDAENQCATAYLLELDRREARIAPDKLRLIEELYLRGTRVLDRGLADLFVGLQQRGVWDNLLLIIVSDHGEEFREHGRFIHSQVYDESIRIPLIIRFPQGLHGGQRIDSLARLTDVLPTVVDYLGIPPPPLIQGETLMPVIRGEETTDLVVLSQDKLMRSRYAIIREDWKLIFDIKSGEHELYNVGSDPGEHTDLSASNPERVNGLVDLLLEQIRTSRRLKRSLHGEQPYRNDEQPFPPEAIERLKSLGYLE